MIIINIIIIKSSSSKTFVSRKISLRNQVKVEWKTH